MFGQPGPGGWGVVLRYNGQERSSGGHPETTNNRMELTAVIEGLSALKEPCEVTDKRFQIRYRLDTKGMGKVMETNGWRKADKSPPQRRFVDTLLCSSMFTRSISYGCAATKDMKKTNAATGLPSSVDEFKDSDI